MTDSFYKNVIQKGNQLLIRAIDKGKPVQFKYTPKPTFFVRSKESCAWKTLEGKNVQPVQLASISSARDFLSHSLHGLDRFFRPAVWHTRAHALVPPQRTDGDDPARADARQRRQATQRQGLAGLGHRHNCLWPGPAVRRGTVPSWQESRLHRFTGIHRAGFYPGSDRSLYGPCTHHHLFRHPAHAGRRAARRGSAAC